MVQTKVNVYSTLTESGTSVVSEARLSSWSANYLCKAVNSGSSQKTYALLSDTDSNLLNLLTVPSQTNGYYTLQIQQSTQTSFATATTTKFLADGTSSFFMGGIYNLNGLNSVGMVLCAVDSRRSQSNDMWNSSTSQVQFDSFGSTSTFTSDLTSARS